MCTTLPTCAVQQVDSYLGYSGRGANAFVKAVRDPARTSHRRPTRRPTSALSLARPNLETSIRRKGPGTIYLFNHLDGITVLLDTIEVALYGIADPCQI
jgi:hypothetical protein